MGTNYYMETNVCPHCGKGDERIHVGKFSMGWPFLFRGYRRFPPDGVPHPITSAVEWRDFIARSEAAGGRLRNEYGDNISADDFWETVERKKAETAGPKASDYVHGQHQGEWIDGAGFRFCDNEFS